MNRQDSFCHRPLALAVAMLAALSVHSQQQVEVNNYCPRCGHTNTYVLPFVANNDGTGDVEIDAHVIYRMPAVVLVGGIEQIQCRGGHDHIISVRTMNTVNGVTHYGPLLTTTVFLPPTEEEKLEMQANQRVEVHSYCPELQTSLNYVGNHLTPHDENGEGEIEVDASVFYPLDWDVLVCKGGHDHVVGVRTSKDLDGYTVLSPMYTTTVYIPPKGEASSVLQSIEYFWDEDPGFGRGTTIALPEGEGSDLADDALVPDSLTEGAHLFGLRLRSTTGWGPTLIFTVTLPERGDTDGDGEITMEDATALLSILLGSDDAEPHQYDHVTADVNRDGRLSIADLTKLVNLILSQQPQ